MAYKQHNIDIATWNLLRPNNNRPNFGHFLQNGLFYPHFQGKFAKWTMLTGAEYVDNQYIVGCKLHYFYIATIGLQVRSDRIQRLFNPDNYLIVLAQRNKILIKTVKINNLFGAD